MVSFVKVCVGGFVSNIEICNISVFFEIVDNVVIGVMCGRNNWNGFVCNIDIEFKVVGVDIGEVIEDEIFVFV